MMVKREPLTAWEWFVWSSREFYFVLLEPFLMTLGIVKMGFGDPTYGRESLPFSESERVNIHDNPNVKVTRRRVYMSGNKPVLDLQLDKVQEALPFRYGGQRITGFIHYYIWEMPEVAAQANGA